MRHPRARPVLPSPGDLRGAAIIYLQQGNEEKGARLLYACKLEVSDLLPLDGEGYFVNITLRSERQVVDQLRPSEDRGEPPDAMKRIKSALLVSLPTGCALGNIEAKAALPPMNSRQLEFLPLVQQGADEPPAPRFVFSRAGHGWKVVFDGSPEFILHSNLGTKYLGILLHRPNETISAFDLEVAVQPEKARARGEDSTDRESDSKAIRSFLKELDRLRADREEALENGDLAQVDRIDVKLEAIGKRLKRARRATHKGVKARDNVRKAICVLLRKLDKGDRYERAFAEHLRRHLHQGTNYFYAQPQGKIWEGP